MKNLLGTASLAILLLFNNIVESKKARIIAVLHKDSTGSRRRLNEVDDENLEAVSSIQNVTYLPNLNMEIIEYTDEDGDDSTVTDIGKTSSLRSSKLSRFRDKLRNVWKSFSDVDEVHDDEIVRFDTSYDFGFSEISKDSLFVDQRKLQSNTYPWFIHDYTQRSVGTAYDVDALRAWEIYTPQEDPIIAVIDSGLDITHPAMVGRIWVNSREISGNKIDDDNNGYVDDVNGYDFKSNVGAVTDGLGHGSHVSGIIAANHDTTRSICGVCPNCKVMPIRFMDSSGDGSITDAVKALEYSLTWGVKISSNSYGTYSSNSALKTAVQRASDKGMLFIAAAGNDAKNNDVTPKYPGGYSSIAGVIGVMSIDRYGSVPSFSNYGSTSTYIAAPGKDIYSLTTGGGYKSDSGTSMSAPIVAAVAAMVWAQNPSLTNTQVKDIIVKNPIKMGTIKNVAGGTVSLYNALVAAGASSVVTTTTTSTTTQKGSTSTGTVTTTTTKATTATTTLVANYNTCAYSDPCGFYAKCTDSTSGPLCSCLTGYSGTGYTCTDLDECSLKTHSCSQNANCVNTQGSFLCSCKSGYAGDGRTCEQSSTCSADVTNLCLSDALCLGLGPLRIPTCQCKTGYTGDGKTYCVDINECKAAVDATALDNGGCDHVCTNTLGSYTCSCKTGFNLGSDQMTCIDIDECKLNNGGCVAKCVNTPGSFECSCDDGYKAQGIQCVDINECLTDNGGCKQNCTNYEGGHICSCYSGFKVGIDGFTCDDIDECSVGNGSCNQICTNIVGSYSCSCNTGYALSSSDGRTCVDIDECSSRTNACSGKCTNTVGSFTCTCDAGYTISVSNGSLCVDLDECATGAHKCTQKCTNSRGSYFCECNEGYDLSSSDNVSCAVSNACAINNGGCSHSCAATGPTNPVCSCPFGYEMQSDNKTCIQGKCTSPTISSPKLLIGGVATACSNGAVSGLGQVSSCNVTCQSGFHMEYNNLTCQANSTWTGSASCKDIDECTEGATLPSGQYLSDPCRGNGGCYNIQSTVSCTNGCPSGYVPVNNPFGPCIDIDECSTSKHSCTDTCTNTDGSFTCGCLDGFEMVNGVCSDKNECSDPLVCFEIANAVKSLLSCNNTYGGFTCACQSGYEWSTSKKVCVDINECATDGSCGDGGVCINSTGSYSCACSPGYSYNTTSAKCNDTNECADPLICLSIANTASYICTNKPGTFECQCKTGYSWADGSCLKN